MLAKIQKFFVLIREAILEFLKVRLECNEKEINVTDF